MEVENIMQKRDTREANLPGSVGEHLLQEEYGDTDRAKSFYENQMLDHLNDRMKRLLTTQEMVFIATSEANGEADCSFRGGPIGFVRVLDSKTVAYPEYRGNGVHASLGNILENPHIGMIFVDFFNTTVGLHINGRASIQENQYIQENFNLPYEAIEGIQTKSGKRPERWVVVDIEEAYIHCAKHIPKLKKLGKKIHWGTDSEVHKGGDFFEIKTQGGRNATIHPIDLKNKLYFDRAKQHCEWCFTWLDEPHFHQIVAPVSSKVITPDNTLVVCSECLSKIETRGIQTSHLEYRLAEQVNKWSPDSYIESLIRGKNGLTVRITKLINFVLTEMTKKETIIKICLLIFVIHYLAHFLVLHS